LTRSGDNDCEKFNERHGRAASFSLDSSFVERVACRGILSRPPHESSERDPSLISRPMSDPTLANGLRKQAELAHGRLDDDSQDRKPTVRRGGRVVAGCDELHHP
jgi:hypothetical protein